jgi:hypothetical protein
LDVGPPGQAANNIMPIAVVGDKLREMAMKYPMIGNNNIWQISPMIMAFG